jgi:SAM-dependent methyltransferase
MVHALREVHRVLKPNGILIDLRPAAKHRRVGLGVGKRWQSVGVMRETFEDDWAANRAVREVLRLGLFRRQGRSEFNSDRVMDSTEDFRAWLDEFTQLGGLPSHEWLIKRLEHAQKTLSTRRKITVRGPLIMGVMKKLREQ